MIFWSVLGWIGNGCFFTRFAVQWWASERAGRSVAPRVFWLSLFGAGLLLTHSAARAEPVLLFGYSVTTAVYLRYRVAERRQARIEHARAQDPLARAERG